MNDFSTDLAAYQPVRFTVDEFLRMDADGLFSRYGRTELIEGEILAVNAQYRPHARIKTKLHIALLDCLRATGSTLFPLLEVSIAVPPDSAPEPDIVLTSEPDGDGLVPLESVALIVEVSDSTIDYDLGRKAALYAKAGVSEYWVADVKARTIRQHWAPSEGTFAESRTAAFGTPVEAATIRGLTISTADL